MNEILIYFDGTISVINLFFLSFVFSVGAYLLFKMRVLTISGSLVTGILGIYLSGFLGHKWILPVLYFFFTSVFFSKLKNSSKNKPTKSGPRNAWQVLANILPAIIVSLAYLFTKQKIFILLYITLIASVTADTWASEIGPVLNRHCFSLADFKKANAGISGGISMAGSFMALLASFSISTLSGFLFFNQPTLKIILILSASGFLATFVDSLLGAFWEPLLMRKQMFEKKNLSDNSATPNDLVNILGSVSAPLFFLLFSWIFQIDFEIVF